MRGGDDWRSLGKSLKIEEKIVVSFDFREDSNLVCLTSWRLIWNENFVQINRFGQIHLQCNQTPLAKIDYFLRRMLSFVFATTERYWKFNMYLLSSYAITLLCCLAACFFYSFFQQHNLRGFVWILLLLLHVAANENV